MEHWEPPITALERRGPHDSNFWRWGDIFWHKGRDPAPRDYQEGVKYRRIIFLF